MYRDRKKNVWGFSRNIFFLGSLWGFYKMDACVYEIDCMKRWRENYGIDFYQIHLKNISTDALSISATDALSISAIDALSHQ